MPDEREQLTQVLIFGTGGFARETQWLGESVFGAGKCGPVVGFVDRDDSPYLGQDLHGLPVLSLADAVRHYPRASFVVGIGNPRVRAKVVAEAVATGLHAVLLVHPNVAISRHVEVGAGTLICAGSILTCDIVVREHVHVNLDCTIGHDVVIEDYVTINPGAHISGNVHIGSFASIGTGVTIINGTPSQPLVIGEGAVVGAQACVIRDVQPGETVLGVPARAVNK